jgi:WD40 repeat protein
VEPRQPVAQLIGQPLYHRDGLGYATFSPDDQRIITCGEDFTAILWDAATSRQLVPPLQHKHQVLHAAFSEDGRWVATACRDGTARLWDATSGEPITPPLPHPHKVDFVQLLDKARLLCARNQEGHFRLWDVLPDPRSVEDLALIAEVLSAQQSGATETMQPASKRTMRRSWRQVRTRYPDGFDPPPP